MGKWLPILLLTLALLPARAHADMKVIHADEKGRFATVAITGEITKTDAADFGMLIEGLRSAFDVVNVDLNSPGGDVFAALQIGEVVRKEWVWTTVNDEEPGAECASACVLVFAAGANRIAGDSSRVGIHRPHFDAQLFANLDRTQAQKKYAELAEQIRGYLSRMGESDDLYQAMMRVSSAEVRWLSHTEMAAMNLVGKDPAYDEWIRARNVARYGAETMRRFDEWLARHDAYMHRCVAARASEEEITALLECDKIFQRTDPSPLSSK